MNILDTAETIQAELEQYDWFNSVGVVNTNDEQAIYIYINRNERFHSLDELRKYGRNGFHVNVKNVGKIRPAEIN